MCLREGKCVSPRRESRPSAEVLLYLCGKVCCLYEAWWILTGASFNFVKTFQSCVDLIRIFFANFAKKKRAVRWDALTAPKSEGISVIFPCLCAK